MRFSLRLGEVILYLQTWWCMSFSHDWDKTLHWTLHHQTKGNVLWPIKFYNSFVYKLELIVNALLPRRRLKDERGHFLELSNRKKGALIMLTYNERIPNKSHESGVFSFWCGWLTQAHQVVNLRHRDYGYHNISGWRNKCRRLQRMTQPLRRSLWRMRIQSDASSDRWCVRTGSNSLSTKIQRLPHAGFTHKIQRGLAFNRVEWTFNKTKVPP